MKGACNAIVWLNGRLLPEDEVRISPFDRGFQFGDGVFETLRAEKGRVMLLQRHVERLAAALAALRIGVEPPPDWKGIIDALLRENNLAAKNARVKIIVTRGTAPSLGFPPPLKPTLLVVAREYDSPAPEMYEKGWDLHIFREGYAPPLAHYKTLNYLYHLEARQAAVDAGCDEAVILDRAGRVSETSAGSILARTQGKWWTPDSVRQLPGITVREVIGILEEEGSRVDRIEAMPEDLLAAETVWVTNSLIGVMPAGKIDGRVLPDPAPGEAARVRQVLSGR